MALAILCIIGFIAYWVPTLAVNSNRHRNRVVIGMLNLFLGWTSLVGWWPWYGLKPTTAKIDDRKFPGFWAYDGQPALTRRWPFGGVTEGLPTIQKLRPVSYERSFPRDH